MSKVLIRLLYGWIGRLDRKVAMALHPSIRRPIEFIGFLNAAPFSEVEDWSGPAVQAEYVRELAQIHEVGGFDRVLIGYYGGLADGWQVAAYVAQHTERLGALLAHRPGFVNPTLAARYASTLDHFSRGRLALHIVTGGSDADQAADGDFLPKEQRYQRTAEYMRILRQCWTETRPFEVDGEFYQAKGVVHQIRPFQTSGIPLFFGGSSEVALDIAARYADLYAMFGEPVADVRARILDLRGRAAGYRRELGYSVSLRPILGITEDAAWERAYGILERIRARKQRDGRVQRTTRGTAGSEGSRRLLAAADRGDVLDQRLWMGIAKETGAAGNSTAPVGTPEQVAETILTYIDVGATTILIRGFEPIEDARWYGQELIPRVRQELSRRELADAGRLASAIVDQSRSGTPQVRSRFST